jgi:hypothetical protein
MILEFRREAGAAAPQALRGRSVAESEENIGIQLNIIAKRILGLPGA